MVKSLNKKRKHRMKLKSNPVAKHANTFNRAATHRDRKNDFKRSVKHRNKRED